MTADYAARDGYVCLVRVRRVGWGPHGSILGGVPEGVEYLGRPYWAPVAEVWDSGVTGRPAHAGWHGDERVCILHPLEVGLPPHPGQ